MTYRTRIGILIGFIALFLIAAPLVVLYTAGYRWNEKKARLEKVGIIYLRSHPSNADIYLDGKLRRETTPTRLRDLLPDTYDVKVAKDGYASWSKKLPVESAHATFAEGIILWKYAVPEKLALPPAEALNSAELGQLNRPNELTAEADGTIFKSDGYEIWVTDKTGQDRETITRLSEEILAILPYTDTGWVIYETENSIHAVERDGRDVRNDFVLVSGENLSGLAVSADGKTLYYQSGLGAARALWRRTLQ